MTWRDGTHGVNRGACLARLCVASRRLTRVASGPWSREAYSSIYSTFTCVTRSDLALRPHRPLPERSAGAMLSSKPPPYDTALVAEARESAGKIEGGFWTKSSSAADYESRARKKLETISGQIQRSGTPGETQRSHYHAAMIAQGSLGYEDAARAANEDAVARAPPECNTSRPTLVEGCTAQRGCAP